MRLDSSSPLPGRGPTRILKPSRRRALALAAALTVISLTAAACGGGDGSGTQTASLEALTAEPAAPASDFMSTRPGAGIAAAGGNLHAISGGDNPCEQPGAEPIFISYVGISLAELDALGLEAIVVEEPGLVIEAYTNEVNFNGGINGRCVEFVNHLWSLADPAGTIAQICTDLVTQQPVVHLTLRFSEATHECATIGAQLPTIGVYATIPEATLTGAGDRLFIDDGSVERLLSTSLDLALSEGNISMSDRIGLVHGSGPSAAMEITESETIIDRFGLNIAAAIDVPDEYSALELLLSEKQVRLLEGGLTDDEQAEAERNLAALPPEQAGLYDEMEQFFLDAANRFKDAGVTAVATTADWTDMRRMIRAAELVDWAPTWVANDIQPATVVLADVPARQAENLILVSSRRAAGDEVPALDQGCVTLRNTAIAAEPFSHRLHTDAWTFITAICDYLDVSFGAMTRIQGEVNPDTFVEALRNTQYDTQYGGLITFSNADLNGAERFRVLKADPECVLNFWGCMRSTTGWMLPANTAG